MKRLTKWSLVLLIGAVYLMSVSQTSLSRPVPVPNQGRGGCATSGCNRNCEPHNIWCEKDAEHAYQFPNTYVVWEQCQPKTGGGTPGGEGSVQYNIDPRRNPEQP